MPTDPEKDEWASHCVEVYSECGLYNLNVSHGRCQQTWNLHRWLLLWPNCAEPDCADITRTVSSCDEKDEMNAAIVLFVLFLLFFLEKKVSNEHETAITCDCEAHQPRMTPVSRSFSHLIISLSNRDVHLGLPPCPSMD